MRPPRTAIYSSALLVALTACSADPPPTRAQCVAALVDEAPGLSHGIAIFDDADGQRTESSGDLVARYRLLTGQSLAAASLTKPIVASDVRKLVEAGALSLDDRVIDALPPNKASAVDSAHADIRIRQLLQHAAGFDRDIGGDPIWTQDFPKPPQANCALAAERVLQKPLDFAPGQRVAYSNAGYCLLGQILLAHPGSLSTPDRAFLQTPLGAAGGWNSPPAGLHARLKQTLPLVHIDNAVALPDGSHYDYGWRHWPQAGNGPEWTHFGRLPGVLTLAVTDGRDKLLVAYFEGDPKDVDATDLQLAGDAWKCMRLSR